MRANGSGSVRTLLSLDPPELGNEPIPRRFDVLVVETHEIARRGLHAMLTSLPYVDDVRSARSIGEARAMLMTRHADVLLLASDLADRGLEMRSLQDGRRIWTLLLIRSTQPDVLAEAAQHDVDGFLVEPDLTLQTLSDALVSIACGQTPMPAELATHLLARVRRRDDLSPAPAMTARERQVLGHLAGGMTNKEIATQLGISHHGVKRHVANLLAKLHAPNRTHAVARALNEGLVSRVGS